jgi:hypothetical protein
MIAVHGPHTWGQPFYAQTEELVVNLLEPLEIEVKSLTSSDIQDGDSAYHWDFGDGTPLVMNGFEVTHQYAAPGEKVITVTVSTEAGPVVHSITINLPEGEQLVMGNGETLQMPEPRKAGKAA